MPNVEVPNFGVVEFPDDMPEEAINAAIVQNFRFDTPSSIATQSFSSSEKIPAGTMMPIPFEGPTDMPIMDRGIPAGFNPATGLPYKPDDWGQVISKTGEQFLPRSRASLMAMMGLAKERRGMEVAGRPTDATEMIADKILKAFGRDRPLLVDEESWNARQQAGEKIIEGAKPYYELGETYMQEAQAKAPEVIPGSGKEFVSELGSTVADMTVPVLMGILTRKAGTVPATTVGVTAMTPTVAGQQALRDKDVTPEQRQMRAGLYTLAEEIPEMVPMGFLLGKGKSLFKRVIETTIGEGVQEEITNVLQAAIDKGTIDSSMTWGQVLKSGLDPKTFLLGAAAGGTLAAVTHPVQKAQENAERKEAQRQFNEGWIDFLQENQQAGPLFKAVQKPKVEPPEPPSQREQVMRAFETREQQEAAQKAADEAKAEPEALRTKIMDSLRKTEAGTAMEIAMKKAVEPAVDKYGVFVERVTRGTTRLDETKKVSPRANVPMQTRTPQEWATDLPDLPSGIHQELSKISPDELGATQEGQLQELRRRISEKGENPETAMRSVWGNRLENASPGLRQALVRGLALPEVSSGTSPVAVSGIKTDLPTGLNIGPAKPTAPISTQDIHALAESKNIPWDNDPDFMAFTESVVGQRHLDDLSQTNLKVLYDALDKRQAVKPTKKKRTPTLLDDVIRHGSLSFDERMDTIGDTKGNFTLPGVGSVFGKNGVSVDGMVEALTQSGWFTEEQRQSGEAYRKLQEMIKDEIGGIKQYYHPGSTDAFEKTWQEHYAPTPEEERVAGAVLVPRSIRDISNEVRRGRVAMGFDEFETFYENFAEKNADLSDAEFERKLISAIEETIHVANQAKAETQTTEDGGRVQTGEQARPTRPDPQEEPAEVKPGETADLLGGKNASQQAIHDAEVARQQKMAAAPPVESGEGDLFSGKAKQTDIEDVTKPKTKTFDDYLVEREARANSFGRDKIMEETRNALAGMTLGRDFNESVEAFYARRPDLKTKADAYKAFLAGEKKATNDTTENESDIRFSIAPKLSATQEKITHAEEETEAAKDLRLAISKAIGDPLQKGAFTQRSVPESLRGITEVINKVFGKKIVYFRNNVPHLIAINGMVPRGQKDTMYLNVDANRPLVYVAGHELTHLLRRDNPAIYNKIYRMALDEFKPEQVAAFAKKLKQSYERQKIDKVISEDLVHEEMIANFIGDNFARPEFWNKLYKQSPSLMQKLAMLVRNFVTSVLKAANLRGYGSKNYFKDLERMRTAAVEALTEYGGFVAQSVNEIPQAKRGAEFSLSEGRDTTEVSKNEFRQPYPKKIQGYPITRQEADSLQDYGVVFRMPRGPDRTGEQDLYLDARYNADSTMHQYVPNKPSRTVPLFEVDVRNMVREITQREIGGKLNDEKNEAEFSLAPPTAIAEKFREDSSNFIKEMLDKPGGFNLWFKNLSTQQHKALVNEEFAPVFHEVQTYLDDISRIANESADLAEDLLPRIESFSDFLKRAPKGKDIEAVATSLFEGTLFGKEEGNASPLQGEIWSDERLRSKYNLNDYQIGLYHQVLEAVANSVDEVSKSLIYRYVRNYDVRFDKTMNLEDVAADVMDQLEELAALANQTDAKKAAEIEASMKAVKDVADKAKALREHGYFPLMRFGKYAVYVTEGDKQIYFGMFDSKIEAYIEAKRQKKLYPEATVQRSVVSKRSFELFHGLSLDALEVFADHLGVVEDTATQEFLRMATAERSNLKRFIHRKGVMGQSRDIPRSLAQFVTSSAQAASTNYHMRNMLEHANNIKAGDVKDEAVGLIDRIRNPKEEAHRLRAYLFINFLGGSLAHGAINLTQPMMVTAPYLTQYTSYTDSVAKLAKASIDFLRGARLESSLARNYKRATDEGIVAPQEIYQLRAQTSTSPLGKSLVARKASHAIGAIYSLTEQFNRSTTFIAAYRIAVAKKIANPYQFAVEAVQQTQFIYNKGNRPNWFTGPVGATIGTFKQFSISYLELAKRLYDTDKKAFSVMMLTLLFLAGLKGIPFSEDIEDLIDTIGQWLGYGTNSKKAIQQFAEDTLGKTLGSKTSEFIQEGVSAFLPIDVSRRLGFQNLIPGTSALKPSETNKARDVVEFFGPAGQFLPVEGTQLGRTLERLSKGDTWGASKAGLPLFIQNALKGYEMATTGEYRDTRGLPVKRDVTMAEAVSKATGFQPRRIAKESETQRIIRQDINLHNVKESEVVEKWARGIVDRDHDMVRDAKNQRLEWNQNNPDMKIQITTSQLNRRVRELRLERSRRFLRSTPPEMRGRVRQELRE